jgi:heavy metal sensor kinase
VSLRWKLVLLYALILAAVIGALSLMLVHQVRSTLMEAAVVELVTHAQALGAELEFEDGTWQLDPESELARRYSAANDRYYFVTEAGHPSAVILASPLARLWGRTELSVEGSNGLYRARYDPPAGTVTERVGGNRLIDLGVEVTKTDEPPAATESRPFSAIVFCGKSLAETDSAVAAIVRDLLILGPLVLLASLAGGWFLVSRAMRPIDRIAKTAAAINETEMSRRIPVQGHDELARLSTTLNAAFDRLQRGFERERQFTADASHELRTPLATVKGNVEVALNKDRPGAEYREILADIGDAATRMQAIVEGLLTLARTDTKAAALPRENVVVARVVEDAVRLHHALADTKRVTVSVSAPEDVVVRGYPEHLRTVFSNLVANAIRYNHDGGRVRIEVSRNTEVAQVRIDDTGIGIPEKDLPHVFERFYRVDQSRTTAGGGGVGLGLAIAKAVVLAHGGTIAASRLPTGGTRFEVMLPV